MYKLRYTKTIEHDPRRVFWDEKDCERMNRHEFAGMRCLLGAVSYLAKASPELQKRLESIPSGKQRMALARGAVRALADDILGTMTTAQCEQMNNVMKDMDMQMVPKLSPNSTNVIMTAKTLSTLVACSRSKCHMCTAMDDDIRACELYKVLEALPSLEDYGDGLVCPYYKIENWG